jgi:hypothetical protein
MTTTYQKLLNKIEAFCNAHLQIKKYKGEFKEQMPNFATVDEKYPIVFVVPNGDSETLELNQFTLEIYCLDIIQKDRANVNTIVSDCHLILKDLYLYFKDGSDLEVDVISDPTMSPLNNDLLDYAAGWVMTITFEVEGYSVCAIPMNPIPPFEPVCQDANYLVQYLDGTLIESGTIPSGGSVTVNVPNVVICQDANYTLTDSDGNVLEIGTIPSGGSATIVAPDSTFSINSTLVATIPSGSSDSIQVRKQSGSNQIGSLQGQHWRIPNSVITLQDTSNNTLSTTNVPATETATITAPDATVENSDATYTGSVESGSTLVLPDSQINVNGLDQGDVVSVQTIDVNITDGVDPVTPDSVSLVGNTLTVAVPSGVAPVGATLMKTGQTTSYRTGDDGDIEAGRDVDFFTLPSNNPFGNTDRFTDELGGSTYANNIVIDWSTYNGVNVLGITQAFSTLSWNNTIDSINIMVKGSYLNWRLPNVRELTNFFNPEIPLVLNYPPMDIFNYATVPTGLWTSTTYKNTPTQALYVVNDGQRWGVNLNKGLSQRSFAVREFTVTGTTLT